MRVVLVGPEEEESLSIRYPSSSLRAAGHEELLIHHVEIDVIVIHEGEQALVEIADAGSTISERMRLIRGIACRIGNGVCFTEPRPAVEDLDIRPTPDRRGPVRLIMVFHPEATLETIRSDLAFMRNHIDNPLSFARAEIHAGLLLNDR